MPKGDSPWNALNPPPFPGSDNSPYADWMDGKFGNTVMTTFICWKCSGHFVTVNGDSQCPCGAFAAANGGVYG